MDYKLTVHARDMIKERQITEKWIKDTLDNPDHTEKKDDGTIHYIKAISAHANRFLRVIINPKDSRVVTIFFDRRFKRR